MSAIIPILVVGGILAIIVGGVWWDKRSRAKRLEEMSIVAREMGFEFQPSGDAWLSEPMGHMRLFTQGHTKQIGAAMTGRLADVGVRLFDFQFVTGSGKNRRESNQVVAAFRVESDHVPAFECRPEGLFHKIGQAFGYQDIDFAEHPAFSKKYLLRGKDEPAVRAFFNEEVLNHLDRDFSWSIEGSGEWIVFYFAGHRQRGKDVAAFFQKAADLFIMFGVG